MKISKGKQLAAIKGVIYGPEGIGKSTLASQFPEPLFLDVENGTRQLDVSRVDEKINSWEKLNDLIDEIKKDTTICRTLVIDTIDAAEMLCIEYLLKKYKKNGIEDFGYGKGYTYLAEEMNRFLGKLTDLNEEYKLNIILLAHSMMRKFEEPDQTGAYDRYELKLQKKTSPLVKEWCDVLLFLNYKTFIITSTDGMTQSKKAQGGERVIYTTHHPAWDAKNRFGLKEELPLKYSSLKKIFDLDIPDPKLHKQMSTVSETGDPIPLFEDEVETIDEEFTQVNNAGIPSQLIRLMEKDNIQENEIIDACIDTGLISEYNENENRRTKLVDLSTDFVNENLISRWEGFKQFVETRR